jgi:hypothetical protein
LRALRLTSAERRHLFSLACEPLPAGTSAEPPNPALQRLVDGVSPYPAYLLNPRWDLLAWNQAEAGLIGDPALFAAPERNTLWLAFTDPAMRRLLVDWRGQTRSMIRQFQADIAQHADDPAVASLTAAVRQASAEFREWWDRNAVAEFWPVRRRFDHPCVGLLTLDYVKLAAVETPEVKLITVVPADAMTSGKVPGRVGAKARCSDGLLV